MAAAESDRPIGLVVAGGRKIVKRYIAAGWWSDWSATATSFADRRADGPGVSGSARSAPTVTGRLGNSASPS